MTIPETDEIEKLTAEQIDRMEATALAALREGGEDPFPRNIIALCTELRTLRSRDGVWRAALTRGGELARSYAESYPQSSDGRNTFIMLAERLEHEAINPIEKEIVGG